MKRFLAKLVCAILGHKPPKGFEDAYIMNITSGLMDGKHYSWSKMPCTRCISYDKYTTYTQDEWTEIARRELEEYNKTFDEINKRLEEELEQEDPLLFKTDNKIIH